MKYEILATGSTGNCTIINGWVAIDMGIPYKKLKKHVSGLRLVLLTHEHGDHFNRSTIRTLARERPALRFGCCEWLVNRLLILGVKKAQIDVYTPGKLTRYPDGALNVFPVETPHDVRNCAYKLSLGEPDGGTLFYATDCGSLDGIEAKGFDLYLVEANHTAAEIEIRVATKEARGEFAYERRAAENHLSWEQAVDWLAENMDAHSVWMPMHGHMEKEGGGTDGGTPYVRKDNCTV